METHILVGTFSLISFISGLMLGYVKIDRLDKEKTPLQKQIEKGADEMKNYISDLLKKGG